MEGMIQAVMTVAEAMVETVIKYQKKEEKEKSVRSVALGIAALLGAAGGYLLYVDQYNRSVDGRRDSARNRRKHKKENI